MAPDASGRTNISVEQEGDRAMEKAAADRTAGTREHGPGAGLDRIEQPLRNSHRERSDAISGRGGARRVEIASARDALLAMTPVLKLLKKQRAG